MRVPNKSAFDVHWCRFMHNRVVERGLRVRNRTLPVQTGCTILPRVEYPFPPVGIVGAADGKNRRAFLCSGTNVASATKNIGERFFPALKRRAKFMWTLRVPIHLQALRPGYLEATRPNPPASFASRLSGSYAS
jgi:hypothetical protein